MSRKKKIKSGYKYKKKTKKASLTTNSIPNVTKKQRYVSYVKQHKPALAHALIKKKNAKYIVYKKMLQPSYLYKRKQLITLSEQKKMNEKKFQVNNFINVANFKLLSRLQLKYNIEDWIKQYFNINATLHVSLPLRHYKNLNWYNLTKKFFTQDLKKTIKKKNIQSTHVEIYRYPLLNRNNTGYLRKKIIKKKNSVYLIMSDLSLKEMNTQDKLFYRQKWYMKTILNRFLPLFSLFSTYYEPQLLTDQIAKELELTKSHRFLYRNLESVLDILKTRCTFNFKVEICGRFNSSVRSKKIYISRGSVITNSFHQRISYAFAQSYARIGCFGVKVWINF